MDLVKQYTKQYGATVLVILGLGLVPVLISAIYFFITLKRSDTNQLALNNAALSGIPVLLNSANPSAASNACQTAEYSLARTLLMNNVTCTVESDAAANPAFALVLSAEDEGQSYQARAAWMPCQTDSRCGGLRYAVILG